MSDEDLDTLQSEIDLLREENHFLKEGLKQGERIRKKITRLIDELKATKGDLEIAARERMQILDSLGDMIFVVDPEGLIQTVNRKGLELGVFANEELIGRPVGDLITDEENLTINSFALFRELVEKNQADELRGVLKTKDGKTIPVLISGSSITNGDTEPSSYIVSAKDVRDSRILKTLQNSQSQLIKTAKLASLGELSAGIAHELNNPLMFVVGYNNRIKAAFSKADPPSREKIDKYTSEISDGAERMRTIIQSFLDFARQTEPQRVQLDINQVVLKSVNLVKEQLRLKSIKVKTEISSCPLYVEGEVVPLEQVIVNFLTNARDALEDRGEDIGKVITIRTKSHEGSVMVEVEDNGTGIPPEIQEKMFDPFFTTKDPGKGTGLGMSITHKIIEDHQGRIQLKSTQGEGTRITVFLPEIDVHKGGQS